MTELEIIGELTENAALLTDKLALAVRAIDALERRVDLFQFMLVNNPPHHHKAPEEVAIRRWYANPHPFRAPKDGGGAEEGITTSLPQFQRPGAA